MLCTLCCHRSRAVIHLDMQLFVLGDQEFLRRWSFKYISVYRNLVFLMHVLVLRRMSSCTLQCLFVVVVLLARDVFTVLMAE